MAVVALVVGSTKINSKNAAKDPGICYSEITHTIIVIHIHY